MPKVLHSCANCQKSFFAWAHFKRKYCSKDCSGLAQRTRMLRVCECCHKEFFTVASRVKTGGGKYCSPPCGHKSHFRENIEDQIKRQTDFTSSPTGCHLWQGPLNKHGYPSVGNAILGKKHVPLHRWILQQTKGPPPPGKPLACHTCHTPSCLNAEEHLYWGSPADNTRDMIKAGRKPHGEEVSNAKLTEKKVIRIRTLYWQKHRQQATIARKCHVTRQAIYLVIKRKNWNHIPRIPHEMA